jgi:hypothetical protein
MPLLQLAWLGSIVIWEDLEGQLTLQSIVVTVCATCVNILYLCILPAESIYVFLAVFRINSDCFAKQH